MPLLHHAIIFSRQFFPSRRTKIPPTYAMKLSRISVLTANHTAKKTHKNNAQSIMENP